MQKGFQLTILRNHHFHPLQEYTVEISCNLLVLNSILWFAFLHFRRICSLFLIKCPNVKPSEDFDSRPDYQAPPVEKQRKNVLMDELTASLLGGHESTPHVSSVKAGNFYWSVYWIFQFSNGRPFVRKYDIIVLGYVFLGDSAHSFPRPASEHGPASHSDFDSGR